MNSILRCRIWKGSFFPILLVLAGLTQGAEARFGSDWSRLLHVTVVADLSFLGGDDVTLDVLEQDTADFPLQFSRILNRGLKRSEDKLTALGLPPKIVLDDLYTFEVTDELLNRSEPIKRRNQFSELTYYVKVENWKENSFDITLRGRVRKNGFKNVKASLSRDRTSILRISDVDRLYFVVTPLQAVGFSKGIDRVGEEGLKSPELIQYVAPPVPSELVRKKSTGRDKSFLVFMGIVEKSGMLNSKNYLLAECPHVAFAGEPLNRIFEKWKLSPAEKDGQIVDSVVSIELNFNLN
jgi:hypothetical protein